MTDLRRNLTALVQAEFVEALALPEEYSHELVELFLKFSKSPASDDLKSAWAADSFAKVQLTFGIETDVRICLARIYVKSRPRLSVELNYSGLGSHPIIVVALAHMAWQLRPDRGRPMSQEQSAQSDCSFLEKTGLPQDLIDLIRTLAKQYGGESIPSELAHEWIIETMTALEERFGVERHDRILLMRNYVRSNLELNELLQTSGLGNHPAICCRLAEIAWQLRPCRAKVTRRIRRT